MAAVLAVSLGLQNSVALILSLVAVIIGVAVQPRLRRWMLDGTPLRQQMSETWLREQRGSNGQSH